jgi:hypothetical protein
MLRHSFLRKLFGSLVATLNAGRDRSSRGAEPIRADTDETSLATWGKKLGVVKH